MAGASAPGGSQTELLAGLPAHGDRLTAVDASFLHREGPCSHMHLGAVMVFDGRSPSYEDFCDHLRRRLHLVPRYRQKLAVPPLGTGRPLWVDDARFALECHVGHTALPAPAGVAELRRLAGRLFSQPLDRTRPLWELWLVDAIEGDRFAVIAKLHHALVDGVSCVELALLLFDTEPAPAPVAPPDEPWAPQPAPGAAQLAAMGAGELIRTPFGLARGALAAARTPAATLRAAREALEGLGEVGRATLDPAPKTPLNVDIGAHRRVAFVGCDRAHFDAVKTVSGATVNDVAIAAVAGALQRWLRSRGIPTDDLELRALVPVSVRRGHDDGRLGNRLAVMRAPLPVGVDDPATRLEVVKQTMDELKRSGQARGAELLATLQQLAPPALLAQASRLQFSTHLFNLIVTNVPGPRFPLYLLGRELQDLLPLAFLPSKHALVIALASYKDRLTFGLLGDHHAMADLDTIAAHLDASLAELVDAAANGGRSNGDRVASTTRRRSTASSSCGEPTVALAR